MGPLFPEIFQNSEAIKNKMKSAFFLFGGSILLLSAEKHNERSSDPGLTNYLVPIFTHAVIHSIDRDVVMFSVGNVFRVLLESYKLLDFVNMNSQRLR